MIIKKNTIGTFKMIPNPNEELKDKTKDFEEYLNSEGNAAIKAIVNKRRTLGLARMLVGNINKGGRKTRKKRRTIKNRKNNRKTKRRV